MNIKPKLSIAFILGMIYFSLFVVLGRIAHITSLLYLFLSLFSGFVYVGYEKLLCVKREEDKEIFCAPYELFFSVVFFPMLVYVILSIINPEVFSAGAIVSTGALIYRILWFVIDPIIKR